MMLFLNPIDALNPNIGFSFFAEFWVWVTSGARGSISVGFWEACQLSPFEGGSCQGAVSTPPPPRELKTRPPQFSHFLGYHRHAPSLTGVLFSNKSVTPGALGA